MNLYAIHEGETLAALQIHLGARTYHQHTIEQMFAAIPQHPAAKIASAVETCMTDPCPYCRAAPGEECRPDCSSYFDR